MPEFFSWKWKRHKRVNDSSLNGIKDLGFRCLIDESLLSGILLPVECPCDKNWDFGKIYDYCNVRGFEMVPSTIFEKKAFA